MGAGRGGAGEEEGSQHVTCGARVAGVTIANDSLDSLV